MELSVVKLDMLHRLGKVYHLKFKKRTSIFASDVWFLTFLSVSEVSNHNQSHKLPYTTALLRTLANFL